MNAAQASQTHGTPGSSGVVVVDVEGVVSGGMLSWRMAASSCVFYGCVVVFFLGGGVVG